MLDEELRVETGDGDRFAFTVFTPTYNRATTLPRVYDSLRAQTYRDFEWLIVDDGSTDGTRDLVAGWVAAGEMTIRYCRQPNAGKHVAFNRAVRIARGELFLTLDSDDACLAHALERLKGYWDGIPEVDRPRFSAVTVLCQDEQGRVIGDPFPHNPTDSTSLEMRYRFRNRAEHWGFHRTDVLRQYPFPEDGTLGFVPESVAWRAISRRYKTRYVNDPLRIYTSDAGARLTTAAPVPRVAAGKALHYGGVLDDDLDWFRASPLDFLWAGAQYARFAWHARTGPLAQARRLRHFGARALWLLTAPAGYALYRRDRWGARSAAHG